MHPCAPVCGSAKRLDFAANSSRRKLQTELLPTLLTPIAAARSCDCVNCRIVFLDPKSTGKLVIELAEILRAAPAAPNAAK